MMPGNSGSLAPQLRDQVLAHFVLHAAARYWPARDGGFELSEGGRDEDLRTYSLLWIRWLRCS